MSGFFRKIPELVVLVLVFAVLPGHAFAVEGDAPPPAPDLSAPDSGNDTFTISGSDVTVNVEKHDTLSVASVPAEVPDGSPRAAGDTGTPTLAETIRSLFVPYTPAPRQSLLTTTVSLSPWRSRSSPVWPDLISSGSPVSLFSLWSPSACSVSWGVC